MCQDYEEEEDLILIPCQNSEDFVDVLVSEIPDDVEEVLEILRVSVCVVTDSPQQHFPSV